MADVEVKIGSIWRENDKRFERYVQVLDVWIANHTGEKCATIAVCAKDGSWRLEKRTMARLSRFGTGYKLVSNPPENATPEWAP